MESLEFGRFIIEYDPEDDWAVYLFDEDLEVIDYWDDPYEARFDIDINFGGELTLDQWQSLWDWVEKIG